MWQPELINCSQKKRDKRKLRTSSIHFRKTKLNIKRILRIKSSNFRKLYMYISRLARHPGPGTLKIELNNPANITDFFWGLRHFEKRKSVIFAGSLNFPNRDITDKSPCR